MKRPYTLLFTAALLLYAGHDMVGADNRPEGRTLAGLVVEWGSRTPIQGATVTLLQRNYSLLGNLSRGGLDALPTVLGRTVTDNNGHFRFQTLSKGPFEISILHRAKRLDGVRRMKSANEAIIIYAFKMGPPVNLEPPRPR